jgi:hypothetical protein
VEYPNAWGRERLVREVTALKKKVAEFEEAAKAVVEEWDANEIGQLDGEYIDKLRDLLPAPPRDVAAEMNELAASQPPIPPDIRARMDADRKKAEDERDLLRPSHEGPARPVDEDE